MRTQGQQGAIMYATSNISEIETLCKQIMNSPYFRKHTPAELVQLQDVLQKVNHLVSDSIPQLISEVKHLRNQNRKLHAEIEALNSSEQRWQTNQPA